MHASLEDRFLEWFSWSIETLGVVLRNTNNPSLRNSFMIRDGISKTDVHLGFLFFMGLVFLSICRVFLGLSSSHHIVHDQVFKGGGMTWDTCLFSV